MKSTFALAVCAAAGLALAIAAATAAAPSTPLNPLRVGLVASMGPVDSFLGAVEVTITNTGSRSVRLPRWQLPAPNGEGQMFRVTRDGQPVDYIGRMVKWGTPTMEQFAVLRPGQTHRMIVDLSSSYDLAAPGQYTVTLARPLQFASLTGRVRLQGPAGSPMMLQSAPIVVWKDALPTGRAPGSPMPTAVQSPRALPARGMPLPVTTASLHCIPGVRGCVAPVQATLLNCSAERQNLVLQSIAAARGYSENAKGYLLAASRGERYTWWYGTFLAARESTAQQNFTRIDAAMDLNAGQISVNCSCDPAYASSYAYVYPNDPYKIYVCNAYWNAPMVGTDSKAGTMIHEMSHFTVVAGTADHAYGQTAARNLAINDPNRTSGNSSANVRGNADSYEYVAENTPARN